MKSFFQQEHHATAPWSKRSQACQSFKANICTIFFNGEELQLLRQRHAYITALAGGRTNGKLKAAHTNQYNVV